jgi:hypothetical protein
MSVVVKVPYARLGEPEEGVVLANMEAWLVAQGITLVPTVHGRELTAVGNYNFDRDRNVRYINIMLPSQMAMVFKLTFGGA